MDKKTKKAIGYNGKSYSIYINDDSIALLEKIERKSNWSKSMIISLLVRKFGPSILDNPAILFGK